MKSKKLMVSLVLMVALIGWNMQSAEAAEEVKINDWVTDKQGRKIEVGRIGSSLLVQRLTPQRNLDPTFGDNGRFIYRIGGPNEATVVELLPNGKIVVAGSTSWHLKEPIVLKLKANGKLDDSFGAGGATAVNVAMTELKSVDVLEVFDKKILVGGMLNDTTLFIVKLSSSGAEDYDFSGGIASFNLERPSSLKGIIVQPNGKIRAEALVVTSRGPVRAIIEFCDDGRLEGAQLIGKDDIVGSIKEALSDVPTDIARLIEKQ